MRKVFVIVFVPLVVVLLACISFAGEYRIVREKWDQNIRDLSTGKLTPTYKGEWVQSVNGVPPRAGERGRGDDGKEYVWVEAETERHPAQSSQQISQSQPVPSERRQVQRPAVSSTRERLAQLQPQKNSPRPGELRRGSDGQLYQWKPSVKRAPLHPNLIGRSIRKGETVYDIGRKYTPSVPTAMVLKNSGANADQAKKIRPGFKVRLQGDAMMKNIDQLQAERDQLKAQLFSRSNQGDGELTQRLQQRIDELETYIAQYIEGSEKYVKDENQRFSDLRDELREEMKSMQKAELTNQKQTPPASQQQVSPATPKVGVVIPDSTPVATWVSHSEPESSSESEEATIIRQAVYGNRGK